MIRLALLTFFCLLIFRSEAQVFIQEEPEVARLMNAFIDQGKAESYVNGWRIKIISTTDRRAMENAKYGFQRDYPSYPATQSYENPYYSLKAGAFETRFDLEAVLSMIKRDYPTALPFRDKILKTELFGR